MCIPVAVIVDNDCSAEDEYGRLLERIAGFMRDGSHIPNNAFIVTHTCGPTRSYECEIR